MDPSSQARIPKSAILEFNDCRSAKQMALWNEKYTPWIFGVGPSRQKVFADLVIQYQQDLQKYAQSLVETASSEDLQTDQENIDIQMEEQQL